MSSSEVETDRVVSWLASSRFCTGLDAEAVRAIADELVVRPFSAGETLASAGDEVTEFWIVAEGELDAFVVDARGKERLVGVAQPGETLGEGAILENMPTRPYRFTARTNGTLLVAPAAMLRIWIKNYSQLMQNLFSILGNRFKTLAGVASRKLASPRLGIVVTLPRGYLLIGNLVSRLLAVGERLRVWARQPLPLKSSGGWPEELPVHELAANDTPLVQPPDPDVDRRIVVWAVGSDDRMEAQQLLACDELLWLLESRDAAIGTRDLQSLAATTGGELAQKVRLVWLLDANRPVAPLLSGWERKKADLKVPIDSDSGTTTRLERQGLDRLVRALRGYSIGLALAGGGAKGMAHLGVLRALEQAGLSFDAMSGTSAGAMVGILYAGGMSPEKGSRTS